MRPAVKTGLNGRLRKGEQDQHSTQLDIIVYDTAKYPVFQRFGEYVVVPPEGVVAIISVKKHLKDSDIEKETSTLKNASKLCRCYNDSGDLIRGPFLSLVSMKSFTKTLKPTEEWIFKSMKKVYSDTDYYDDLIGYIGSFSEWSIFKTRPKDKTSANYIFFKHTDYEMHLGLQFILTGILSVYYDSTRSYLTRPGFTAFPSKRDSDKKLGTIKVQSHP